jgi:F-box-like
MNHADSQKLIDVRRKMKDKRATDYAMMLNHESWKQGSAKSQPQGRRTPIQPDQKPSAGTNMSHSLPMLPPFSTPGAPLVSHLYPRPPFLGPPMTGPIAYSPLGMNPVTPSYAIKPMPKPIDTRSLHKRANPSAPTTSDVEGAKRPLQEITPSVSKPPRVLAQRLSFDAKSSRKKLKKLSTEEEMLPFFGEKLPTQSLTSALTIFSFLSNDDTYRASLVSKRWNKLAMHEDLWKFG